MRLYDQTQQEAIQFRRRLAFGNCSCWCYLQALEIWVPPGEMIGCVRQQMSTSTPVLFVYDESDSLSYCIEGPESFCSCVNNGKDKHFKVTIETILNSIPPALIIGYSRFTTQKEPPNQGVSITNGIKCKWIILCVCNSLAGMLILGPKRYCQERLSYWWVS